uniref:CCHC-type domain-containing protein n=1 Tax=Lactuca sativa TaxID=4236 RepID=A0A9R1W0W2_LACSA|nr:hypothetical protein LSAT_V11C300142470 [Lactuca sativa]
MDHGKVIIDSRVSGEGTSGLLPLEKLKVELELSDSEGSPEPTTPLRLSERDVEDEDVESEVEPGEDLEEDPKEDPNEEPEEDLEEEPEGNHVEYHVEQRYETFHIPYVEYTPTSPGQGSYRRTKYGLRLLRKVSVRYEGWNRRVVGRDPPQDEVLVIQSGSGDRKAKKIRKYLKDGKRILKYDDIVFKKSGRFARVTPEEERIPIGAYVRAPGDVPETPLIPNASRGRDQGRCRVRGRGRGAVTTSIPVQSAHDSSGSHRGRGRGRGRVRAANTITREELADKITQAIRATLPDIVAQARQAIMGDLGGGEEGYEYNTPNINQEPSIAQPSRHHDHLDQRGCSYKTFMNCMPPIKGTFDTSKCADEDKGMVKEVRGREAAKKMSWDEFIIIFKENFFPRTAVKQLEEEFLRLEQGNMTMREYTTKFTEKARVAKFYVSTEERRVEHCIWGLRTTICEFVQIQKLGTFHSIVDVAEGPEHEKNRQREDKAVGKRKWDGTNNDSKKGKTSGQKCRVDQGSGVKQCPKCNHYHKGECNMNQKVCYKYGKPGHIATECKTRRECYRCGSPNPINSECPQSKGSNIQGRITDNRPTSKNTNTSRPKARAFCMTAQEAQESPDVVTGSFLVNSIHARVLFDSGANRSFLFTTFSKCQGRNAKTLEHALEIETPDDHWVVVTEEYDECSIEIEGSIVPLKLLPTGLGDFDVVIGMDWLSENQAIIDCENRTVQVWVLGKGMVKIYGDRRVKDSILISVTKATRYLKKGCQSYWAYVLDAKQDKPEIAHIPVLREFQDAFPNDLTNLSPDRQVEFRIDLTPGVAPIAHAPYRLAPTEMKELMAQLQDLLDKGGKLLLKY